MFQQPAHLLEQHQVRAPCKIKLRKKTKKSKSTDLGVLFQVFHFSYVFQVLDHLTNCFVLFPSTRLKPIGNLSEIELLRRQSGQFTNKVLCVAAEVFDNGINMGFDFFDECSDIVNIVFGENCLNNAIVPTNLLLGRWTLTKSCGGAAM